MGKIIPKIQFIRLYPINVTSRFRRMSLDGQSLNMSADNLAEVPTLSSGRRRVYIGSGGLSVWCSIISFIIILTLVTPVFSQSKKDIKQAQIYRDEGYKAQRAGNLDMALSYYQRAINIDPEYAIVYNDIGVILEAKGQTQKAKEVYLKAVALDPRLLSSYFNLAALYEKEQNYQKAAHYWRMRIQLGDWRDVWTWRAKEHLEALKTTGRLGEKGPLTESDLGLGAASDPKHDAEYHLHQGKQFVAVGDYVKALKEFDKAILLDPNNNEIEQLVEETNRRVLLYK